MPAAMADTPLMQIPGNIDPVTVPRDVTPRADGRIDLLGLPRPRIAELFAEAGLDAKAAKLRAKQVFHWLYHRGVTEFEAMTDIAKTMRPGQLMVLESSTYPGTTREVFLPHIEKKGFKLGQDVFLAYSPEREDPGNPQSRVAEIPKVVGGLTPACRCRPALARPHRPAAGPARRRASRGRLK